MYLTFWNLGFLNIGKLNSDNVTFANLKVEKLKIGISEIDNLKIGNLKTGNLKIKHIDIYGYLIFIKCCEGGDRKMMKIGWIESLKSWMLISYRSKNMKWKFGKSYKTFLFSSKGIPSTPQHTDSQPCTRPGWSRSLSELFSKYLS